MKKILSIILSAVLICALAIPAFAADNEPQIIGTTYTNEYDYILAIQYATSEELSEMGLTKEQANKIVTSFEIALHERAALPEEALIGYGYTQDQIAALRSYNAVAVNSIDSTNALPLSTMRAITGTCTGTITASYLTTKAATFKYTWSWDHAPIMKLKDSAAIRWLAFDSNGYEVDVTKTSDSSIINYYWNGSKRFTRYGTKEPDLEFNSLNLQFDESELFQSPTTMTEEAYAGDGYIQVSVKVEPEVTNTISYLKVAALYGHTTIGVDFPSIGLSPTGDISIGFSGNISIDPIGGAKVKIAHGSSSTKPSVTNI